MKKFYKLVIIECCINLILVGCLKSDNNEKKLFKEKSQCEEIIKGNNNRAIPEAAKSRKDLLIVGINEIKGNFNPLYSTNIYDGWAISLMFEGLVKHDEKGKVVGNIAKEWAIGDDGKKYTFTLKENIKFSDGRELTAEDVAFTYTALCDPNYTGPYGNKLKKLLGYSDYTFGKAVKVEGIKIENKYQISFLFTESNYSLIYDFEIGILSKKHYNFQKSEIKKLEEFNLKPIGSGAYKFISYEVNKRLVLVRNENYFKGTTNIKNLTLKVTPGDESIKELSNGQIDMARISISNENIKYFENLGFMEMHIYDDNGYQYLGVNLRNDKFKDRRIRQALMYGLDREKFIKEYYGEYGTKYNTPLSICSWAYPTQLNNYNYDISKAKRLLEEVGWMLKEDGYRYNKNGEKFNVKWSTYEGSSYVEKLIPRIQNDYKQLGINIQIDKIHFNDLVEKVYDKRDFEMYNMYWVLTPDPDPSPIFSIKEDVPSGYNSVGWRNDESEKLIQDALKEKDIDKRKALYEQWGKIANEELPYLYLNQNKEMLVNNIRVKGLKLSPYKEWTNEAKDLTLN